MTLTHRERLQACISDDPALDHVPAALWRHFPVDDQQPGTLATAALAFQSQWDFDLVKVTPASSFSIKDWGAEDVWEGHTEGTRRYTRRVVQRVQDWETLPVLEASARHLAAQLECLKLIRSGLPAGTPILQTIFSPLAQAKNLAGSDVLVAHLRQHPQAVLRGLQVIAETTRRFVEACLAEGIDGVFYAVQHAQAGLLTLEEYRTFGLPNDLVCLEPARDLWCNLLHLHGLNVYFDLVPGYAGIFSIINWHDRETPPSLSAAQAVFPGLVCGGVGQDTIVYASRARVQEEARDALRQTRGRRLLLGTGCVVPVIAPHGNLQAVKDAVLIE